MTAYVDRTNDFAQRTLDNLAIIDALAGNHPQKPQAREATQLVNSSLGLLVVTRQHYDHTVPVVATFQWLLGDQSTGQWRIHRWNKAHDETAAELLRRLRNGLSHFRWDFAPESGEITDVRIRDRQSETSGEDFEIEMSLECLRRLVERLSGLVLNDGKKT